MSQKLKIKRTFMPNNVHLPLFVEVVVSRGFSVTIPKYSYPVEVVAFMAKRCVSFVGELHHGRPRFLSFSASQILASVNSYLRRCW